MKKIFCFCLILIISIYNYSVDIHAESYDVAEKNITVIFQDNSNFNDSQKVQIINYFSTENPPTSTYSILCLFGHKYITEYVHVVKHEVFSVAPRCANQLYEYVTCERCDYADATLVSQIFINCCPEE